MRERKLTIKIDLPDDISRVLEERWGDLPRHVLATLAIQGYRDGTLSTHQVQLMLGLKFRFAVDAFMKVWKKPTKKACWAIPLSARAPRRHKFLHGALSQGTAPPKTSGTE